METFLIGLTLVCAVANWMAAEYCWRRVGLVAKPCTMIALIAWFSLAVGWERANLWFGIGLIFSLVGDILLMFSARWFMPGLVAFLIAHICYITGFNQTPLPLNPLGLVFLAGILGLDIWFIKKLVSTGLGWSLAVPVGFYMATISIMALSALICLVRPEWSKPGALAAGFGAVFFLISDCVLAYNRFVAATRHGDLVVMSTYHLAQIGLVLGLIWK